MLLLCFEKEGGDLFGILKIGVSRIGKVIEGVKIGRKRLFGISFLGERKREIDMRVGVKKSRRGLIY